MQIVRNPGGAGGTRRKVETRFFLYHSFNNTHFKGKSHQMCFSINLAHLLEPHSTDLQASERRLEIHWLMCIDLITQGSNVLCLTDKDVQQHYVGSLCFLPRRLAATPASVPHHFSSEKYVTYVTHYPDPKAYRAVVRFVL